MKWRRKYLVAALVSWVAGFVDAVCYIALFHVFVANMTGNTIALGVGAAEADWSLAWRRGLAIPLFMLGMAASRFWMRLAGRGRLRPISASVAYAGEALVLLAFIWLASAHVTRGEVHTDSDALFYLLVALPSFAMGIQNAALSHFGPLSIRTTHVTGTLAHSVDEAARFVLSSDAAARAKAARRSALFFGVWVLYALGALIGVLLKLQWELASLYLPVALLLALVVSGAARVAAL